MTLSAEERKALVANRIEKSRQTLHEAKGIMQMKFWSSAANRLYYACYYITGALLVKNGYIAQTHTGVARLLGLHFIKTGLISKEIGKTYNKLFELRQTGDYDDWRTIEQEDVEDLLQPAEKFIETVEKLLNE
ncbi:MAG: HEPN domain-containing protein [Candidatus Azobacteroides sp.]|nr:HEPN domain-containing protein [Candidatus Azobacteroides sp.]